MAKKRIRKKQPVLLTEMQLEVLKFLHQHRAASVEEIGRVADSESEPLVQRQYYHRMKVEGVECIGRVGWGALLWLYKRGLVKRIYQEGLKFYEITPKGRMVLLVFIELGLKPLT